MKTNLFRIQNDIETLSTFNSTPNNGLTRFSFTEEDKKAREYIKLEMNRAGLRVYEDSAGTIIGRLEGSIKNAPVIMIGSHYDSVKNGGNFDGNAGVVAALEIARVINENNILVKYPIEFVAMIEEEGGRFGGGLFGSRGMAGKITRDELDTLIDSEGTSIAKAMKDFGFDPDKILEAARKPEELKAFLELHIEQGPILEHKQKDVGIVEYIVGISQLEVTVAGRADHAGTTPMNMRIDALDAASTIISKIGKEARALHDGSVATVGNLSVIPGAANIVSSEATFTVDIRSKNQESIDNIISFISHELQILKEEKNISYTVTEKLKVQPVKLDERIIKLFHENCEKLNLSSMDMLSGAGHDAMVMSDITNIGLIFVPSKNGRSHCPEEWTNYEDLQKGIELMYHTLLKLAEVM